MGGPRPTGPIVARFRPRSKAKWAIGRIFMSYGRVLKTRPQNRFFVVNSIVGYVGGIHDKK